MHLASLNKISPRFVALRRIMIGPDLLERVVVPHIPPTFFFLLETLLWKMRSH
jgi:hypothetical protein